MRGEPLRPCPLCDAVNPTSLYVLPDDPGTRPSSGQGASAPCLRRKVLKCPECGLLYSSQLYSTDASRSFYDSEEFWEGPLVRGWSADFDEQSPEVQLFRRALAWLKAEGVTGRMLDVGCSSGLFLELARREGWNPHGVEISQRAVELARGSFGLEVFCGTLEEAGFQDGSFDAVALWDVIEHFDDPKASLREIARITRPGGALVLCTPNCSSLFHKAAHLAYRVTLGRVKGILPLLYSEKHNTYFTPASLDRMLSHAAFQALARQGFSAHLGRWLRTKVPWPVRVATHVVDRLSGLVGGRYRMLVFARRR